MGSIGVPVKLLHETQGHILSLELKNGTTYRGRLIDSEDNMNLQLKEITVTGRDGHVSHLDQVFIRGSQVRFFVVPDMLKNAPMFKTMQIKGNTILGKGKMPKNKVRGKPSIGRGQ